MNVSMNSVAVEVVAALRRPVMPSFHAAWSFGGLAGAALGGLLAPHLAPLPHFAIVGAAGLAVTAWCGRTLLAHPSASADTPAIETPDERSGGEGDPPPQQASRGLAGHAWRVVLLFGLIALCSAYGEGAIGDWGALHLRQDLGAGPGLAAAGYAAFALAEACGRLAGSWLLLRLGQTRVLVLGGLTACAGMLAAALAPAVPVALAGFALTGLGVANMFPAAMTRAGLLAGPNGVAVASTLGYTGFLLGPPTIGFLATAVGLRAGLTTVSALAVVATVLALLAPRDDPPGPPARASDLTTASTTRRSGSLRTARRRLRQRHTSHSGGLCMRRDQNRGLVRPENGHHAYKVPGTIQGRRLRAWPQLDLIGCSHLCRINPTR